MKNLLFFSVMSLLCLTISAQNWEQLGNNINGSAMSDYFGMNASLSSDGSTVAIGAPNNDENGNKSGQIRVFNYDGTTWIQKGNNINGQSGMDYASMVELSADGATVAVGSWGNYSVKARIFDFDGSEWILRGSQIPGLDGELAGGDLSLSADGNRIVIGAPGHASHTGVIRVYYWNGTSWNQLGSDINGAVLGNKFGNHVKFNADGNTFITGTEYFASTSSFNGKVSVYEYNGSDWTLKGNEIIGYQQAGGFGNSVDISDDGNTIIAGESGFRNEGSRVGRTRIFSWNGSEWVRKGTDIEGLVDLDKTGTFVAINGTGNTIATKGLGVGSDEKGNVRIFRFDGTDWAQQGQTIVGQLGDMIGYGLDFTTTGDTISIGNVGIDYNTGQMKIYRFDQTLGIQETAHMGISIYPNPSTGLFTINLSEEYSEVTIQISNMLGQIISTKKHLYTRIIENEINVSGGVYFVRISKPSGESTTLKVIKQ